jgi:hypothetical protein
MRDALRKHPKERALKPIIDKAEVAIDFPDKTYFGTFSHNSVFDVACDAERVRLRLSHPCTDQRTVEIHLHYYLLADILGALAQSLDEVMPIDEAHYSELQTAVRDLEKVLTRRRPKGTDRSGR